MIFPVPFVANIPPLIPSASSFHSSFPIFILFFWGIFKFGTQINPLSSYTFSNPYVILKQNFYVILLPETTKLSSLVHDSTVIQLRKLSNTSQKQQNFYVFFRHATAKFSAQPSRNSHLQLSLSSNVFCVDTT